jgi:hypothetical protein
VSLGNLNSILSYYRDDSVIDVFCYSKLIKIITSFESFALYFNRFAILSQMDQVPFLLFKIFIMNRSEFINFILKFFHFLRTRPKHLYQISHFRINLLAILLAPLNLHNLLINLLYLLFCPRILHFLSLFDVFTHLSV